jgi:hypothetical protein
MGSELGVAEADGGGEVKVGEIIGVKVTVGSGERVGVCVDVEVGRGDGVFVAVAVTRGVGVGVGEDPFGRHRDL